MRLCFSWNLFYKQNEPSLLYPNTCDTQAVLIPVALLSIVVVVHADGRAAGLDSIYNGPYLHASNPRQVGMVCVILFISLHNFVVARGVHGLQELAN